MTEQEHETWDLVFGQGDFDFNVYLADGGTICTGRDDLTGWKARAHLIAAAPDLLAALEKLLVWGDYTENEYQQVPVLAAARAAISKSQV